MSAIRIKICCLMSKEEIEAVVSFPISAVGFVSNMPSGPGVISETTIAAFAPLVPPGIAKFLLTSSVSSEEIIGQQRRCLVNVIQLCEVVQPELLCELRTQLPGISLIPVVHVIDRSSIKRALELAPFSDALLLDSGSLSGATRQLGGTGKCHDWRLSREIRDSANVPVFLAGGLNPSNVAQAIEAVRPFGVDVCSGVRTNGGLDTKKLTAFVAAVGSVASCCN